MFMHNCSAHAHGGMHFFEIQKMHVYLIFVGGTSAKPRRIPDTIPWSQGLSLRALGFSKKLTFILHLK